ncbi:hypothetical protein AKJ43_00650 [candidate division MSBL1 archaeon SCGC-AAA261D19]|uniref:Uncharacterized protein n=1 Tax=candidate division MSBL1 archaeon SCGC-AAA261D19 TaxID=1698273 RepID=A0A133V8Q0_9EURY|nr:hypothetical protein AKJ43_00650 [candidate division MSBL1 archaeon SCGC-AAA261D19]
MGATAPVRYLKLLLPMENAVMKIQTETTAPTMESKNGNPIPAPTTPTRAVVEARTSTLASSDDDNKAVESTSSDLLFR